MYTEQHQRFALWYGKGRWKKRRAEQLAAHPLCALCLRHFGLVVPATVADHVDPHYGDRRKFEFGRLQSLCAPCHESVKRTIENRGYSTEVGLDGWPVDRRHPCYAKGFTDDKANSGNGWGCDFRNTAKRRGMVR